MLAGAVQLIGLQKLKQQLGPAWDDVARQAYDIAEGVIKENLAAADIYERYDDETYIVCFADLDRSHSERKARRIVDNIRAALLNAASEVRHIDVSHSVAELPSEELTFAEEESLIDALAGSLRQIRTEVEEAQQAWRRILLRDANIVYSPIWNPRNRTVLLCRCLLDDLTGKATLRRIETLSLPEDLRSTLADLDCVILDRAVRAVHQLVQRDEKMIAVVPVNFHTLNEKSSRDSYLRLCKDMPSSYSQFIMLEVHGMTTGVPPGRMVELCQYVRPYCKGIIIEAPSSKWDVTELNAANVFAISVQLDQDADAELRQRLEKLVNSVQARGFHSMAHAADTMGLARMAVRTGVEYISGKAVALPLEALKGGYHWTPATALADGPLDPQAVSFPVHPPSESAEPQRNTQGPMAAPKSPRLRRLFEDWQQWRAERAFPSRADFDPADIQYILGNVSLIDVRQRPLRFRFRLHGSDNAMRMGVDLTGKDLDEMPQGETREVVRKHFEATVVQRTPITRFREGVFSDGRVWHYEALVLPFSRDGETIDMLLSAVVWRQK